jgi:hypothetical protein
VGQDVKAITLLAAASLILAAGAAQAGVYDFSFSDGADSASGVLTTAPGGSPDTVIGISGYLDGQLITGLSPYAGADQLLYDGAPFVDFSGVSFNAGGVSYNVYNWNGADWLLKSTVDPVGYPQNGTELISGTVSSAPEPGTWALMVIGIGMAGAALRRRPRPAPAAAVRRR